MQNVVRTKNSTFFLLFILCILFGCNDKQKEGRQKSDLQKVYENIIPLAFEVSFEKFGLYQLDMDSNNWKIHMDDSVIFLNVNLLNTKKESFVIKASLVATGIPFLIQYQKIKYDKVRDIEYVNLNIVQVFNTIYTDSIIFEIKKVWIFPL